MRARAAQCTKVRASSRRDQWVVTVPLGLSLGMCVDEAKNDCDEFPIAL